MFGLWHQWSCLSTCEWPLWNLWMAPAELMGGPENSKKWLKSHNAKKVVYRPSHNALKMSGPRPYFLYHRKFQPFFYFCLRSSISMNEWISVSQIFTEKQSLHTLVRHIVSCLFTKRKKKVGIPPVQFFPFGTEIFAMVWLLALFYQLK